MTRQKSRKEMEARIEERRVDCEARRQQLASQMAVLERHNGQLAVLNASRRRERLKEVELLQNQVFWLTFTNTIKSSFDLNDSKKGSDRSGPSTGRAGTRRSGSSERIMMCLSSFSFLFCDNLFLSHPFSHSLECLSLSRFHDV